MLKKSSILWLGFIFLFLAQSASAIELAGIVERIQGSAQIISGSSQKTLELKQKFIKVTRSPPPAMLRSCYE